MVAWFRDFLVVQKEILADKRLDGKLYTGFELKVNPDGTRLFDTFNSGTIYEGIQHRALAKFQDDEKIVLCPGIGYSDVTVMQKSQDGYWIYTTCGCIPDELRAQPWAWGAVALIPKLDKDACAQVRGVNGPTSIRFRHVEISNLVISTLMDRYAEQTAEPLFVCWGGREVRRVYFVWAMWLGDCPELQCIMGEMPHTCIRCTATTRMLTDLRHRMPPKDAAGQQTKIRLAAAGRWPGWAIPARRRKLLHPEPQPLLQANEQGYRTPTRQCSDALYERVRRLTGCHLLEYALHNVEGFDPHFQVI